MRWIDVDTCSCSQSSSFIFKNNVQENWIFLWHTVSSRSVNTCIDLHNDGHSQGTKHFQTVLRCCPVSVHASSHPQPLTIPDLFSVTVILPFPKCHINQFIQIMSFWTFLFNVYTVTPRYSTALKRVDFGTCRIPMRKYCPGTRP